MIKQPFFISATLIYTSYTGCNFALIEVHQSRRIAARPRSLASLKALATIPLGVHTSSAKSSASMPVCRIVFAVPHIVSSITALVSEGEILIEAPDCSRDPKTRAIIAGRVPESKETLSRSSSPGTVKTEPNLSKTSRTSLILLSCLWSSGTSATVVPLPDAELTFATALRAPHAQGLNAVVN